MRAKIRMLLWAVRFIIGVRLYLRSLRFKIEALFIAMVTYENERRDFYWFLKRSTGGSMFHSAFAHVFDHQNNDECSNLQFTYF